MSVILKAGDVASQRTGLSTFQMRDLLAEARGIIDAARDKADEMLVQAQNRCAGLLEQARQEGYKKGHDEGLRDGRREGAETAFEESKARHDRELRDLCTALGEMIEKVGGERQERLDASERDLLGFAIELGSRAAKKMGHLNRKVAQENLRAALALVMSKSDVVVSACSRDLETLERFAEEHLPRLQSCPHLQFVADEQVSPGGVRISSPEGEVDATLETQLEQIVALLTADELE